MNWKIFIEKEPILLKLLYVVGVVLFIFHLNEITSEKFKLNWIYPILSIIILLVYFVRILLFNKKTTIYKAYFFQVKM